MRADPSDQERIRQGLSGSDSRDMETSGGDYTTSSSKDQYRSGNTADGFNDVPKSQNTGPITTATNTTNESGFTHPEHDMSAAGRSTSDEDRAGGITTATNRTTGSGFTSPGQDMGGDRSTSTQDLNRADSQDLDSTSKIDSKSKDSKIPSAHDAEPDVHVSGPGPRDISTVAKEHGGDAGNSPSETTARTPGHKDGSSSGNDSGLPADQSEEKGTGELYVKSSGLKADGGDFDATKPGAGREADRLMEQKGISPTGSGGKDKDSGSGGAGADQKSSSSGGQEKEKHSLVDKIKEKLHKH